MIKAYSNSFVVEDGPDQYECLARGRFRRADQWVVTGDRVQYTPTGEGRGVIEVILPRQSYLERPPVANVDQCIVVMAPAAPPLDLLLLDRFLLQVAGARMEAVICLNKTDLEDGDSGAGEVLAPYRQSGYPVIVTSSYTGQGLEELAKTLSGRISVLAGPSGVGKSSLLNALDPALSLATGALSRKTQRGTHTTRAVSLLRVGSGFVADTPGFTHLDLQLAPADLAELYPEMAGRRQECRFRDCLHRHEPGCSVVARVESGEVDRGRYERYLTILQELKTKEDERW
ncbi:MAG: ribosome small subunit-dependent GTPase A [Bacillota bacterium]